MDGADFEWDAVKEAQNVAKHGVTFDAAQRAFLDPRRVIAEDIAHSDEENDIIVLEKWTAAY
ncbi:MAG: BrnT family toxin [Pirellulales bacterium]|nr:BrnT family toxin [Pirellulales bacterium]